MALKPIEIQITADPTNAEQGFGRIQQSIRSLDAATDEYERGLAELNRAQQRGLITARQAERAAERLSQDYERAAREAAQFANAQIRVNRETGRAAGGFRNLGQASGQMRGQIQNASFQIQDIAVQMAMGTSATQALGQQLPQLLGGFGILGAAMGAVVAVGGALAPILYELATGTQDYSADIDDLSDATERFRAAADRAGTDMNDLVATYGEATKAARELLKAQRDLAEFDLGQQLNQTIADLAKSYGDLSFATEESFNRIANRFDFIREKSDQLRAAQAAGNRERVQELTEEVIALGQLPDLVGEVADEYETGRDAAQGLLIAIRAVQTAEGPRQQAEAAADLAQKMLDAAGSMEKLAEIGKLELYQALVDAGILAADFAGALGDAADNASAAVDALNQVQDPSTGLRAGKGIAGAFSGIGGEGAMTEFMFGYNPSEESPYLNAPGQPSSRGRSGGGKKDKEDRIGALARSLATETEMLENWREESLEALADFNSKELELLGGHAEAKERIEAEYLEREKALKQKARQQDMNALSSFLGDVAGLMESENKTLFNIGKAAAIADAIIKSEKSILNAYEFGTKIGGPAVGGAMAAAAAAATAVRVANIASQEIGGGSRSGGGAAPEQTSAAAAAAIPTQTVAINLQGDTFSRASVEGLLEQIQSQLDRGGRLVFQ